jgi:hypothetical protein
VFCLSSKRSDPAEAGPPKGEVPLECYQFFQPASATGANIAASVVIVANSVIRRAFISVFLLSLRFTCANQLQGG